MANTEYSKMLIIKTKTHPQVLLKVLQVLLKDHFFLKIIARQFTFLFIVQWFRQSQFRIEKDSDWKYDPHKGNEWISKIIWQLNMLPSSLYTFFTGNCLLLQNVLLKSLAPTASNLNSCPGKKNFFFNLKCSYQEAMLAFFFGWL